MKNNCRWVLFRTLCFLITSAACTQSHAKVHYVHSDHLGTPVAMTDQNRQITWKADYTPFGGAFVDPNSTTKLNLRLPGQYYDEETGLHHNYFRDYDPHTGRYIQSDPVGLKGGINTYNYALANPLINVDPFGLWVMRCARALAFFDGSGTPMKPSGNPLRHDYLSVSGAILSFQSGTNMFWSKGYVDKVNERSTNPKCVMVCNDDNFDQYVLAASDTLGAPTYCIIPGMPGAKNCQSWASDVLALAKQQYLENESCPKCFADQRKRIPLDFTGLP